MSMLIYLSRFCINKWAGFSGVALGSAKRGVLYLFYTFQLDSTATHSVYCLVDRAGLNPDNGLESGFLARASRFKSHGEGNDLTFALKRLLNEPGITHLVISKNRRLVLDDGLLERLSAAIVTLDDYGDGWALASAGGLGLREERYCALYSSATPFILFNRDIQPIVDTMLDLFLVHADALRSYMASDAASLGAFFEIGLILHGYKMGRVSLFLPVLSAGVDGPFTPRDLDKMSAEAAKCFPAEPATIIVRTLSGPITIEGSPFAQMPGNPDPLSRRPPRISHDLDEAIRSVIARYLPVLSLSIVTRTQFKRPHLLRRMLTSVNRAKIDGIDVEIILSSDIDQDRAERERSRYQEEFPTLTIRLALNQAHRHSRVGNMIGGMRASTKEYVWMVDDDDYIDLFAFQTLRSALFSSSRPLIVASSQTHTESWLNTDTEFPVLSASKPAAHWPARGWRDMFGGINRLPICGAIIPREFLLRCLDRFEFRFDLSEDYTLFLLLLTAPDLPRLLELNADLAHISLRESDDNVMTVEDRSHWTRDIVGFLFDLLHGPGQTGLGAWSVVAAGPPAFNSAALSGEARNRADLIAEYNRRINGLQREVSNLEALLNKRQA